MHWQHTPYTIPLLLSAATAAAVGLLVLKYRAAAGAPALAALFAAVALWAFEYAMEMGGVSRDFKMFWGNLQYLSVAAVPVLWMVFALQYSGRGRWVQAQYVVPLSLIPVATAALVWTDPVYGLVRQRIDLVEWDGLTILAMVEYGPWFWIHAAYIYAQMGISTLLLIPRLLRNSNLYRGQAVTLLIGLLAPWGANAIYLAGMSPFPYLDLTPFAFLLMALAGAWGLFGYQLLDVVPVARHAVVEGLRDGVVVLDSQDRVVDANPVAQTLLRLRGQPYIGLPAPQVLAPLEALVFPLEEENAVAGEIQLDHAGDRRHYELQLSALHDRRGQITGRLVVLRDITERKRAEEDLIRSQRLRAAGELSLGVSHNLNNILTGIIGPTHQLQQLVTDAAAAKHLETVITSAQRAKELIQRLGHTVEEEEGEPRLEPVAFERAVPEAVEGARPRWQDEAASTGRVIEVRTELGNVPRVAADPSGLHDILLNLIFNAVDAMPEGGAITISTRYQGQEAVLSCGDSGTGMDEATRQRIFEPFFTTKADVGTGLGLATAYKTVQRWGGRIEVESAPGQGATFSIYLPLWQGSIPEEQAAPPEEQAAVAPTEPARILLVEDEMVIGMMVEEALRADGHEVVAASRGEEALARFAPGAFDLVIVDLGIPDRPGDELASEFKERDPAVAALLVTGWNLKDDDPRRRPFDGYVRKPFHMDQIRRTIGRILADRSH